MELQLVKKDIYNKGDYHYLEDEMIYYCNDLLEEKNLPLVTFKLWYDLSYSQGSWVWFKEFNISFNELIKYLLEIKTLTQIEYDILYSAHEEWLYDFDYRIWNWNKVEVDTQIYNIYHSQFTNKTYPLLKQYKNDEICIDQNDNSEYFTWDTLSNILSEHWIELVLKDLLDSLSSNLKKYWYDYIELEDEWQCKNILFDNFMQLNNIEHNIEIYEWWEYLFNKKDIETNINWSRDINDYTLINNNNLNDYYISNNIINSIESKERTVQYYSLTI